MLKGRYLHKMPVSEQQPRIVKIERPVPGKRASNLKMSSVQPQSLMAKKKANVTEDLGTRLAALQRRVKEWQSSGGV
ncbi:uncharacterized protein LOC108105958 [Drosophila eugracilis]|uniref:uncharacterized protein LOC108105958 n=1 Tax=Drosophila eugracilis TaxID=29029 RepID=UPI0007E74F6C|nr:uncharacterized protein LOC108105958 [Drosophila eugracilis]